MTQLQALLLSILIEVPVVLALARALGGLERVGWRRLVVVGCAATLLTHPFAWHGFSVLRDVVSPYPLRALVIEGGVAVVEGLLYGTVGRMGLARGQALGWASNAVSYGIGLVLFRWVLV